MAAKTQKQYRDELNKFREELSEEIAKIIMILLDKKEGELNIPLTFDEATEVINKLEE